MKHCIHTVSEHRGVGVQSCFALLERCGEKVAYVCSELYDMFLLVRESQASGIE